MLSQLCFALFNNATAAALLTFARPYVACTDTSRRRDIILRLGSHKAHQLTPTLPGLELLALELDSVTVNYHRTCFGHFVFQITRKVIREGHSP